MFVRYSDIWLGLSHISIYLVHEDAKEKEFELEMSWIGDETGGVHIPVPNELQQEAEAAAKAAIEVFEWSCGVVQPECILYKCLDSQLLAV